MLFILLEAIKIFTYLLTLHYLDFGIKATVSVLSEEQCRGRRDLCAVLELSWLYEHFKNYYKPSKW